MSDFKRRLALALALAAIVAVAGSVALAGASFSAPVNVSDVGAESPRVASDSSGDSIVVWENLGTNPGIFMRTISAAGVLGTSKRLSPADGNAETPQIAVNADGDAIAVWKRSDGSNPRIEGRTISAAGTLGPLRKLSAIGHSTVSPQIAIDGDGDGVAVWNRVESNGETLATIIEARRISAASTLGPIRELRHLDLVGADVGNPQVAIDGDDDAVVAWQGEDEDTFNIVEARTISSTGVVGPLRSVSTLGSFAGGAQVASNGDNGALVTWVQGSPSDRLRARTISAAGVLGPVRNVSPAATADSFDDSPQIATDGEGDAVVAWQHYSGDGQLIRARTISAAGVLGPIQNLSLGGSGWAEEPQVATNGNGGGVVIYQQELYITGFGYGNRVDARKISAAGVLGPRQAVGPLGRSVTGAQIATDADGDAAAVWTSGQQVKASQGP